MDLMLLTVAAGFRGEVTVHDAEEKFAKFNCKMSKMDTCTARR